jgi:hypothetical protein
MAEVDRRHDRRVELERPCTLVLGGRRVRAVLRDLSQRGGGIRTEERVAVGDRGRILLDGMGVELGFVVLDATGGGLRVRFDEVGEREAAALADLVGRHSPARAVGAA